MERRVELRKACFRKNNRPQEDFKMVGGKVNLAIEQRIAEEFWSGLYLLRDMKVVGATESEIIVFISRVQRWRKVVRLAF